MRYLMILCLAVFAGCTQQSTRQSTVSQLANSSGKQGTQSMFTYEIKSEFRFHDRVKFNSNGAQGTGQITFITLGADGHVDYMVSVDGKNVIQPALESHQMTLLQRDGKSKRP